MIDPDTIEGKAAMFIDFEDRLTLFDTLILCRFYRDLYPWEALCEIARGVAGIEADRATLKGISANISNMVRKFNIQEGMSRKDDRLPTRLYKEALKGGHQITEVELERMVTDYYRLRGWDENGFPKADHAAR
jgi:aldehyde:ferredoxin oxidoreductase